MNLEYIHVHHTVININTTNNFCLYIEIKHPCPPAAILKKGGKTYFPQYLENYASYKKLETS